MCQFVSKETVVYSLADLIIANLIIDISVSGTWYYRVSKVVKGVDAVEHHLYYHGF